MIIVLTMCDKEFATREFPSVFTISAVPKGNEAIIFSGNIIWRNSGEIKEMGFIWQVGEDPINKPGFKINIGAKAKSGNYQAEISSSLKKDSKYILRAYAITGNIKTYGEKVEFVPDSELPIILKKFEPITGHSYDTVKITGERFNSTLSFNQVKFDDLDSRIIEVNDTVLKCLVPYGIKSNQSTIKVITNGLEGSFNEEFTSLGDLPFAGLLAYFPFNGNANDESGHSRNGSVHGASLTTDRFDNPNSAYYFNGISDYISLLPPNSFIGLNNYSISFWVKPTGIPVNSGEIMIGIGSASSPYSQAVSYKTSATSYYGASYNVGNNPIESYSTACCFERNNWVHVVITRDSYNVNSYINGTLIIHQTTCETNGQDADYGTAPFAAIIGGRSNLSPKNFFKGIIDEVRIFDRALSDNEIAQLANLKY